MWLIWEWIEKLSYCSCWNAYTPRPHPILKHPPNLAFPLINKWKSWKPMFFHFFKKGGLNYEVLNQSKGEVYPRACRFTSVPSKVRRNDFRRQIHNKISVSSETKEKAEKVLAQKTHREVLQQQKG